MLLIHRHDGLGAADKTRLSAAFTEAGGLLALDGPGLERALGRRLRRPRGFDPAMLAAAEADAAWLASGLGGCLAWGDPGYPAWLAMIDEPPWLLFYRGCPPSAGRELLAVVGTRRPDEAARRAAWELGRDCAACGVGLVSGLAFGIDAAAHAGAAQAGGYTAAVLPGGIDLVQPAANRGLAARVLDAGGCLLSEWGPGTPARPWHFPVRNRIISGLCPATVVVQAPEKSGALITADYALEQGRDVYVHSAGCPGHRGTGTRNLAEQGAAVIGRLADLARGCVGPG